MSSSPTYQYLQLEGSWPSFVVSGLDVGSDGVMTLAHVPTVTTSLTPPLASVSELDGPAGIGVDCDGTLYVADPPGQRILRVDPCDGHVSPLACLSGPGSAPGQLNGPRGVHVGRRGVLYIADAGNARVQVVDLASGQILSMWGQADPWGSDPTPSTAPGRFQQPWDVTADRTGAVYVADPGVQDADGHWSGGRVQKFTADGQVVPLFSTTLATQAVVPGAPASIAIGVLDPAEPTAAEHLLVLDRQPARLLAYHLNGDYDASATAQWDAVAGMLTTPVSVAIRDNKLYVADGDTGQVLAFGSAGGFLGIVRRTDAPVAGLGFDCHGRLVVHPGSGGTVQASGATTSYATCGTFLAGPFQGDAVSTEWQRMQITLDALPPGAHLQLYCLASNTMDGTPGHAPSAPAACGATPIVTVVTPATPTVAPLDTWRAAARDAGDVLALTVPSRFFWVAGVLQGDSTVTPTLRQIRLEYDVAGWLQYLPAIYRNNPVAQVFLDRALAMFRSFLDDEYGVISALPQLFDAGAAPDSPPRPTWLDWLATWFAVDLDERWTDAVRRQTVADGFRRAEWRGTRSSLTNLVALYSGVTPWIEELGTGAAAWALDGASTLGFDTVLAAESPDGAVLGETAIVDRSALIESARYGAPIFADVANRFSVQVYAAELSLDGSGATLDTVRSVIDREKPAHTTYDLCVIDARMRVGAQARLGIDTIVGGSPPAEPFDGTVALGTNTVLADESTRRQRMSVVGQDTKVGIRSTLV